jgi:hypothetical protein
MFAHSKSFRVLIASMLAVAAWAVMVSAVSAQIDASQENARTSSQDDYERYRDSRNVAPIPPPPPKPARIVPEVPEERIAPRFRYNEPTFDEYWHDRLQQFRFQDWYGDNYRRYWPPNYRGHFRKQDPPYYWWNDGDGRRDTGWRAWQAVRERQYR